MRQLNGNFTWGPWILLFAVAVVWLILFLPASAIPFRVEQWDIYDYYLSTEWHLSRATDWLVIAFWTPFKDYRFIPLAYIWNFEMFRLLGTSYAGHRVVSIALNVANAFLLAKWVNCLRDRADSYTGPVAACIFLLSPVRQELVMWTFFTYKSAASAAMLLGLIRLNRYSEFGRPSALATGLVLIGISSLMYESSLPLPVVALGALLLRRSNSSPTAVRLAAAMITAFFAVYAAAYLTAHSAVPPLLGLNDPLSVPAGPPTLRRLAQSATNWSVHGILLPAIGAPIEWRSERFHIAFSVLDTPSAVMRTGLPWLTMILGLRAARLPWRLVALPIAFGCAGSILVLYGRTLTDGTEYLSEFGMYQHVPVIFVAAAMGMVIGSYLDEFPTHLRTHRRSAVVFAIGAIGALVNLGISCSDAVRGYVAMQAPLVRALDVGRERILAEQGDQTDVSDIKIPFRPASIPQAYHTYHVFHLLYGDAVSPPGRP